MGYQTDFSGEFEITPELTAKQVAALKAFAEERHEGADERGTTYPELYCQWVPSDDGTVLEWDQGEKFYSYVEWLDYLIERFFVPWGHTLDGSVIWEGEERDDMGTITVENNVVTTKVATITW